MAECLKCASCPVRQGTEWGGLGEGDLAEIDAGKQVRTFKSGEILFTEGSASTGVYCLRDGLVGIRKLHPGGLSRMLRLGYPGETLGYRAFLLAEDHQTSCEALQTTQVCHVPGQLLRGILTRDAYVGMRFVQHAARDLKLAEETILRDTAVTARTRFLHALMFLFGDALSGSSGCATFELQMSRQDLAEFIGISPETVSRMIAQLSGDGILSFQGRTVHIRNIDAILHETRGSC